VKREKLISEFENYNGNSKESIFERFFPPEMCFLNWEITNICNFRCEYCQNNIRRNKTIENHKPVEELVRVFENTNRKWFINITGGEPFLFTNFMELISTLSVKHHIAIDTNLSSDDVYKLPQIKNIDNLWGVFSSVHFKSRNNYKSNLEDYIDKVLFLQKHNILVFSSCIVFPDTYEEVRNQINYLLDRGIKNVSPKLYIGTYKGKSYPNDYDPKYIKKLAELKTCLDFDYIKFERKTKGKMCLAGESYFFMDAKANLSRCTTISENIGNFFTDSFESYSGKRKCNAKTCMLSFEGIMLTKCVPFSFRNIFK